MTKKKAALLILFCASFLCAHAETIILRTGARVKGNIVFENEEVVIVRNEEGQRFQYPRAEVEQILSDDQAVEEPQETSDEEEEITTSKKASILLELAGGAAVKPGEAVGGGVSVDLLVGSHHLGDKHIFVGGGLGYHGVFLGAQKYNFLPIQVAMRMPLIEQKHAPVFGVAVGYWHSVEQGLSWRSICRSGFRLPLPAQPKNGHRSGGIYSVPTSHRALGNCY